jgi:hypothetical protein
MTLDQAREQIEKTFEAMRRSYGEAVFDEWAIIALGNNSWTLVCYSGPRRDTFSGALPDDLKPLADTTTRRTHAIGDFEFAPNAPGTRHDAMLRLGESTYLLCNNTRKGMAEIRSTQRWLKAQPFFAALSETFQSDPLIVPPTRGGRAPGEG